MTDSRYRDFDQAWAEKAEAEGSPQPLIFKLKGREWQLPGNIPAAIIIKILRMKKRDPGEDVPEDEQMDMALSLFGEEQLDQLLGTGIDVDQLGDLIMWALDQYGLSAVPNRAARREGGRTRKPKDSTS